MRDPLNKARSACSPWNPGQFLCGMRRAFTGVLILLTIQMNGCALLDSGGGLGGGFGSGLGQGTGTGLAGGAGLQEPAPLGGNPGQAGPSQTSLTGNQQFNGQPAGGASTDTTRSEFDRAVEAATLQIINQERAQAGAGPLTLNERLGRDTAAHSAEQAQRGTFFHGNFNAAAENVAQNQSNGDPAALAQRFMDWFRGSPAHKNNYMNPSHTQVGIGSIVQGGGTQGNAFTTQQFL